MSDSSPMLRLAAIRICAYRGFPNPVTLWLSPHDKDGKITGKGQNLLLYGENGSGKSSIGKAIRDFLDFRVSAVPFDQFRYRYADPARTDRKMEFVFDDSSTDILEWNPTQRDTAHKDFNDMARSRTWLDYRSVWRISEVTGSNDYVEIFDPLVAEILTSCLPTGGGSTTFGEKWKTIKEKASEKPICQGSTGYAAVTRLENEIKQFNGWLETFLPGLETKANDLLKVFVPWTKLKLSFVKGASYDSKIKDKFSNGSIHLQMLVKSENPLGTPSEFINEARITAIGLCLYLAGMSLSIPPRRADDSTYPRLLVLDDVLLSLDMVHRLPLLSLLKSENFKDWQILLLTHDRAWYEMSKQQLEGWSHHELFAQQVGDYEQPLLREDQDHLMQSIDFLHEGYVKAAAVHMRTKFELVLKWACSELGLAVKYHPEARKVPASEFWSSLSGAMYDKIQPIQSRKEPTGKVHYWRPKPLETPVIPLDLKTRISHALRWVLNPLSHSQSVDHYRPEIEAAIYAVNDLEFAVHEAISIQDADSRMLRELLLSILQSRAT